MGKPVSLRNDLIKSQPLKRHSEEPFGCAQDDFVIVWIRFRVLLPKMQGQFTVRAARTGQGARRHELPYGEDIVSKLSATL
ncbi:MAG: hypothetical protein AMJ88_03910 [Anaerolineae bacterium SM23_ 63]|nr:MAG: hypothetical protein AMJ88_03910 [Anaerolineae bacterium SM23_ 63]